MFNPFKKKNNSERNLLVGEFAHAQPDMIIIVADPKDDTIFVAYNNKFVSGRIRSAEGNKIHIVNDVLKQSTFNGGIDKFIMALVDIMKIKKLTSGVNNFLQFIDGSLYNLSQRHRSNVIAKMDTPKPGAIKSPYVAVAKVEPEE